MASEISTPADTVSDPSSPRAHLGWRIAGWVGLGVLLVLGTVSYGAALWVRRTFGPISFNQLLMNTPGIGGGAMTDAVSGYANAFLWQAVAIPLLILAGVIGVWLCVRALVIYTRARQVGTVTEESENPVPPAHTTAGAAEEALAGAAAPPRRRTLRWIRSTAAVVVCALGVFMLAQTVGFDRYIRSQVSPLDMNDYYVQPELTGEVLLTGSESADAPLNLITIYLESADALFSDATLFEEDLLEAVTDATQDWQSIDHLATYQGGGWTMAGVVGTQCGVPLRGAGVSVNDIQSNEIGANADSFMPGAVCIGDVLSDAGYSSVFLGGADEDFASKGTFLSSHGFDQVKGLSYWEAQGSTDLGTWGLSDRSLFAQARDEVAALHEAEAPFYLSMLTLDFHEPLHLFDYCPVTTTEPMSSVLKCSMSELAQFIDYLEASGILEDTAVVIMGDHPKMVAEGGAYWDQLSGLSNAERPLYNRIWSPNGLEVARESADQLSMYASLLDLVGIGTEDGRAGLGSSVFTEDISRKSALSLPADEYELLLESRSAELYERLWQTGDPILADTHR